MTPVDTNGVIYAILTTDQTVRQLVDTNVVPLGKFTEYVDGIVVYALRGGETNRTLDGDEEDQNPSVQIDCYASSFERAQAIHDAVYARLSGYGRNTIAGHLVHSISVAQARDDDEPLLAGQTIPDTVYTLDASLWLQRAS